MMEAHSLRSYAHQEIRVLIVEDALADARLILHVLARSGLTVTHRIVQEERAFREALVEFRPDIVLTDNKLPRFSGRRALRISRRHDPLLPVILVTGTLSEDRAIRLTYLGLANYVFKDQMLRLGPAVLRALERTDAMRTVLSGQRAIESSERRFRAVAEASGDGLIIVDANGRLVFWNAAAERMFGYPAQDILGSDVARLLPESLRDRHGVLWAGLGAEGVPLPLPFTREVTGMRADGSEFPAELTVSGWDEDGLHYFSAQVRDITQRREEARTRQVLSQAIEQTVTSIAITDTDGRIEYVNPAFERLTGYTRAEVIGQTPRVLKSGRQAPDVYEDLWGSITDGGSFKGEVVNRRKDGTEYTQELTVFPILGEDGTPDRFVGVGLDVTQERMWEAQFRQAQKMEAVGQLAGGIAHDFNNILTGVLTNAQLLDLAIAKEGEDTRDLVDDILAAARRGGDLVRRLMTLARSEAAPARRVDVRGVVDEALRTVRRILPESIELSVVHAEEGLFCMLDEGGLHQALFNVANNARDAMPDGGTLTVRTRVEVLAPRGNAPIPCVVIEVEDSGEGMPEAVRSRLFEPFFTTKEAGRGTGLGLSMVYSFVTQLGGDAWVESVPDRGTTLFLALPLSKAAVESPRPEAEEVRPVPSPGESGTILVAEDQEDILRVAEKVLSQMGFEVITATDGETALELLREAYRRVDLVLADMVMPRGGAGMLYRETREWPDRPRFLFMSGYEPDDLNGDGELLKEAPFLAKPFTVVGLQQAVRAALKAS